MNRYAYTSTWTLESYLREAIRDGKTAQAADLRAELAARNDPAENARRTEAMKVRMGHEHTAREIARFTREHGNKP